ncbi:MAG: glycoside hydrolase family 28 protein, partial [Clostridia bacterium]|nr:glycoside hydrolase family 28 protein [Clostridia bacterium]
MRTELFSAATDSSVTLWWDQPDQASFPARYAVLIDGRPMGGTERTHWTAEGLSPETEYCF